MRPNRVALALGVTLVGMMTVAALAQPGGGTLKIASVTQWVVSQHQPPSAEFGAALDSGVVDRTVFWWQRGVVQRRALVPKPVRVLPAPEADPLGGRGDFDLAAVRPPTARSAWAEVDVVPRSGRADDVLVVEVGGELNVATQVLATLLVLPPGGTLQAVALAPRALVPADGVPVVTAPYGLPVVPGRVAFRSAAGVEFLVARSPIETVVNGATTVNGPADVSPPRAGEWREGDRVFIRIPLGTLRGGAPAIVLGWKDRVDKVDPDGSEMRRARLRVPVLPH